MPIPTPPRLPIARSDRPWRVVPLVAIGVAQAAALILLAALSDGVVLSDFWTAVLVVVGLAAVNALAWPLAIRVAAPLIAWTVGLFTLVLNAVAVLVVAWLVDGFEVASIWSGLVVALTVTAVTVGLGGLLHVDDDQMWDQLLVRRLVRRREPVETTTVPGVVFIQIDGLGVDVLRSAMATGHAPTLAALVEHGTHRVTQWECDLSSQTGAMQAGILLGDNSEMPAFRWYEKDEHRVMVSNRPQDAADIESRRASGVGLLRRGGASRANVFSGEAPDALLTFSRLRSGQGRSNFVYMVARPYALLRIIVLGSAEIVRELRDARRARRDDVVPRMHRGGTYPLLRAATTVVLEELTQAAVVADIARGVPAVYVDLVGYDEVAHHSGIAAPEALATLRRTDERIRRIMTTIERAPRPYFVVVLSDHGQTQGSTFRQRYGETLDEVVRSRASGGIVEAPVLAEEGWTNVNGMLTDAAHDESRLGRVVERATRSRRVGDETDVPGEIELGPSTARSAGVGGEDIVVLASGNLGLLSFTHLPGRATRQRIEHDHPGLLDGLAAHPGIGFVLVRDEVEGDVAIGGQGVRYLDDDRVDGIDPLEPFGPNAADHLRRTSSFRNCPDVLLNSFYDPVEEEGAAFEELIGFHGGLGGPQTRPFVLAPTALPAPGGQLVGARAIHEWFSSWIDRLHDV